MKQSQLPSNAGIGLKAEHYQDILSTKPDIGWVEIHAENYMAEGGPSHYYLTEIAQLYPLSVHGVGLSIGGAKPLDKDHLNRLKILIDRYQPASFSEHLAWSTHETHFYNDLLPVPYNEESLSLICDHIDEVQNKLNMQMLLENPSSYLQFETSIFSETDFLSQIAAKTGCGLLLDVNNVFISATNLGFTPKAYIDSFPLDHVKEVHLGGHAEDKDTNNNIVLIDAHDRAVADPVWELYQYTLSKTGALPSLIEWDNDVPTWDILHQEAKISNQYLNQLNSAPHAKILAS